MNRAIIFLISCILAASPFGGSAHGESPGRSEYSREYQTCLASPDGIGKIYLGREIAQVMGHQGASWLDRPERADEERTDRLIAELQGRLKPDAVVADIGAGSGYFSLRVAPLVPKGRVLAEDIDSEMLKLVEQKIARVPHHAAANVQTILGTIIDPKLPPGRVDCVLLIDTYHEWDHPCEMMAAILRELKPGGEVIQLEYRAEDESVRILAHHKMTEKQARLEMEAAGLQWVETKKTLPQQHLLIYTKPVPETKSQ